MSPWRYLLTLSRGGLQSYPVGGYERLTEGQQPPDWEVRGRQKAILVGALPPLHHTYQHPSNNLREM